MAETAGGFEWGGDFYRFEQANCCLGSDGELRFHAWGDGFSLESFGVRYPGTHGLPDLAGQVWEPDDWAAAYPDIFSGAL